MSLRKGLATIVLATCWLPAFFIDARVIDSRSLAYAKYSTTHSLGDDYVFDARDGWESMNVTDLKYKYSRLYETSEPQARRNDTSMDSAVLDKRAPKKSAKAKAKSTSPKAKVGKILASSKGNILAGASVAHALDSVWNSLKGIGKPEPVTITWYTGHDLENPSCWANGNWAPTDNSFACALTLEGWTSRPQCFKFLELCNGPKTCVFVRVVDTCAGCAAGSKHVDLTKAAFSQLADIGQGVLSVQMRPATEPTDWFVDLWGPQH